MSHELVLAGWILPEDVLCDAAIESHYHSMMHQLMDSDDDNGLEYGEFSPASSPPVYYQLDEPIRPAEIEAMIPELGVDVDAANIVQQIPTAEIEVLIPEPGVGVDAVNIIQQIPPAEIEALIPEPDVDAVNNVQQIDPPNAAENNKDVVEGAVANDAAAGGDAILLLDAAAVHMPVPVNMYDDFTCIICSEHIHRRGHMDGCRHDNFCYDCIVIVQQSRGRPRCPLCRAFLRNIF